MPAVGVIDDRNDLRETLVKMIHVKTRQRWGHWNVVGTSPFREVEETLDWMRHNEVWVLLVDWRLFEQGDPGQCAVSYSGADVIRAVRSVHPAFPIFMVSSYLDDDEGIESHFRDVEDAIKRSMLTDDDTNDTPIERLMRAGSRILHEYNEELDLLTTLATKAATGHASPEDLKKLRAVQAKIGISSLTCNVDQASRIDEAEAFMRRAEELKARVIEYLGEGQ